jgi:hypothetical protein
MSSDWINWGLWPTIGCALLVLVITRGAGPGHGRPVNEEILMRGFQGVLAVSALLFLVAFWLDGHWTNVEKLSTRIWLAAGGARFTPTSSQLAAQDNLAFESILASVKTLTLTGCAIGVAAIIGSLAGLGFAHSAQLIVMAAAYQVFVLSRHPYYAELLQMAADGELIPTTPVPSKRQTA